LGKHSIAKSTVLPISHGGTKALEKKPVDPVIARPLKVATHRRWMRRAKDLSLATILEFQGRIVPLFGGEFGKVRPEINMTLAGLFKTIVTPAWGICQRAKPTLITTHDSAKKRGVLTRLTGRAGLNPKHPKQKP
jgi:hypothetical protein